jgi:hypothetical protein
MYPDMDENNYYRGEVKSAHPSQGSIVGENAGEAK